MKAAIAIALSVALGIPGCAAKAPPPLPTDPLQRASYCAALAINSDTHEQYPEFAIQYLVLGSLKDGKVDIDTYRKLTKMTRIYSVQDQSGIATSDPAACFTAYPSTDPKKPVQLPADPDDKLFGCDGLIEGLATSMTLGEPPMMDRRNYDEMATELTGDMVTVMKAKKISLEKATARRDNALTPMLAVGNAYNVMEACRKAFPPKKT